MKENLLESSEDLKNDATKLLTTKDNHDENNDQLLELRRSDFEYREIEPPENLGYINIYIRQSNRHSIRQQPKKLRFPVARYHRRRFPLHGPFLSFTPRIPILADRLTKQTIIYSPTGGIYILPPLINFYGKMFSIAELIVSGYASLVSNGGEQSGPINILSYFQPMPLYGRGIPRINPMTGSFIGDIRTSYKRFDTRKYSRTHANIDSTYDTEDDDEKPRSYQRNYYKRRHPLKRPHSSASASYPAVLYIWSGQDTSVTNAADFVAVIDFNEKSATYGHIRKTVSLISDPEKGIGQINNEAHHSGISSNKKYYITGDGPKFICGIDAPGACPDEFLPIGNSQFLVTMMCNESAGSLGNVAVIDADTCIARSLLRNSSDIQDFNPHAFGRLDNGSIFTADYILPVTLTNTDALTIVFRNTVRHFFTDGSLQDTFQVRFPTEPGSTTGLGHGIGFMELKTILNDPLGRALACGTNTNIVYLFGAGIPEPVPVLDASQVNDYIKRPSAGLVSIFPDGSRMLMPFQMRFVLLVDIVDPLHPKFLRTFDFCTDESVRDMPILYPGTNQTTTFSKFCLNNSNVVGSHGIMFPNGENRFVVLNYFLKFGLTQFSGTRTVHAFKLNKDLTNFTYDHRFNPNFQFDTLSKKKYSTFHSLNAYPHHAQYLKL
ncbi:unnamed protein product [Adineta steineri]|uniref:Uncharacterized protein n=1 Tax=Adineta steineri TaxID=433720 RepID=A0A814QXN7_9BILA|nr:unnamed protein product [Adineta steineri]CAF3831335.1 unnamed protein product [Adineta steineri]